MLHASRLHNNTLDTYPYQGMLSHYALRPPDLPDLHVRPAPWPAGREVDPGRAAALSNRHRIGVDIQFFKLL